MIDLESVTRFSRCWSRANSTDMGHDSSVCGTNDTKRPIGKAAVMRALAASRTRRVGTGRRGRAKRAHALGVKTKRSHRYRRRLRQGLLWRRGVGGCFRWFGFQFRFGNVDCETGKVSGLGFRSRVSVRVLVRGRV